MIIETPLSSNERLAMYAAHPAALEEEVARVLRPLDDESDRIKHNCALSRFIVLFPTPPAERRLWQSVARAIIETARQGAMSDGKENRQASP